MTYFYSLFSYFFQKSHSKNQLAHLVRIMQISRLQFNWLTLLVFRTKRHIQYFKSEETITWIKSIKGLFNEKSAKLTEFEMDNFWVSPGIAGSVTLSWGSHVALCVYSRFKQQGCCDWLVVSSYVECSTVLYTIRTGFEQAFDRVTNIGHAVLGLGVLEI